MSGIIDGKKAHIYDKHVNTSKRTNKKNSFLKRNIKGRKLVVADLCCGSGISFELLLEKADKIYGVDASKEMISICRENYKDNKLILLNEDVRKTSITAGSCDYAVIRMGLHHIKDKQGLLDEASRILKKGGKLLMIDRFRHRDVISTYLLDFVRNWQMKMHMFQHSYITLKKMHEIIEGKFIIESIYSYKKDFYTKANIVLRKV
ncbi:class I SAM-dependent methyltransferase [Candidatus Woesearchaeota archaeon]|nr:class I SAM-dependent methyltransferase [Candidatus Woesearchaeota archaeon]